MTRYCAREFSAHEMDLIRALIAHRPAHSRAQLSQLTCQALHWYKPDGELKQMSCRVAMLRMHADGFIELPPPRGQRPQSRIRVTPQHRFTGTCYQAANWLHVGQTKGRGKLGPAGKQSVPIKDLWLYPLDRHFKRHLTR